MRGRGRVYRPINGSGKPSATWMLDFTVGDQRFRESSGLAVKDHPMKDAVAELERRIKARQEGRAIEPAKPNTLRAYADTHVVEKAKEVDDLGQPITVQWLAAVKQHLARAVEYFGATRALGSIIPDDVVGWVAHLRQSGFGGGSQRQHINSLSNLYTRAIRQGVVGANPVTMLLPREKPKARARPAKWLEVHEAALLLETARTFKPKRADLAVPYAYPLIATLLLTGGRPKEVLGLEIEDVNFKTERVLFRPNQWRRLKTAKSERKVRLWPQLKEILQDYMLQRRRMGRGRLLFPVFQKDGGETMLGCVPRKMLNSIGKLAGWKKGELNAKMCRHTYGSARAHTLDNGAPVDPFTVAAELGHSSLDMIEKTYFHQGRVRHRAKYVEYRVEQHKVEIRALLKARKVVRGRVLRLVA